MYVSRLRINLVFTVDYLLSKLKYFLYLIILLLHATMNKLKCVFNVEERLCLVNNFIVLKIC